MSRTYRCDECDEITEDPIEVCYWVEDEDEDVGNDWHLCSWACLAAFGMNQHVNHHEGAADG